MIIIQIELLTPKDYIGALMELAQDRRGEFKEMKYIAENRASLLYELPLAEVRFYLCTVQIVTILIMYTDLLFIGSLLFCRWWEISLIN